MTNEDNALVIMKKLLSVAKKTVADSHLRKELVDKIANLAEKFSPDTKYYIDTMNQLFEIGAEDISDQKIQALLNVIAEGSGEGEEENDEKIRTYCVDKYVEILNNEPVIHDKYMHVIAWILGEYGYLSEKYKLEELIESLCFAANGQLEGKQSLPVSSLITAL